MHLGAGDKLGPYEIHAMLGVGGMGQVFRAYDTRLRRTVAIKVLPPEKMADSDRRNRFLQEARAASAVIHPNIVVLHDIASESGIDFLVMEYVTGETLKNRIKNGPRPIREVVSYGKQIATALAAAHKAGVIHRDIKPSNIMVTADSQIKVLDFGLARLAPPPEIAEGTEANTLTDLTQPGVVMGTVAYMSPEQTRGELLDEKSDIFSLGSVLYEAATGILPFQGNSQLAVMHNIASAIPTVPSQLNRDLTPDIDDVIAKALAKDKRERYASAGVMADAFEALESAASGLPAKLSVEKKVKRSRWLVAALSAGLLIAGAATARYWARPKHHMPHPEAYQLYLQGRRNIQEFTEHGFKQSVVDFTNALQRDPEYAAAYAGLADAYTYLAAFELARPKDVMPLAESNAAKAIEKDPETAEAYASLGITAMSYYWDYPLAEQRLKRSLRLNPRDAFTQHYLGHYYEVVGHWSEALNQMRLALSLDKLSPMYGEDLGIDLIANRRIGEAIRQLTETTVLAPEDPFAHSLLALALEADGRTTESLAQAEQALQPGAYVIAGSVSGLFCRLGRRSRALDLLQQLEAREKAGRYISPLEFAMVQFALGDKTSGLARMRYAVEERCFNLVFNLFDPVFDVAREDPEFAALMNQIHVPEACWRRVPRYVK